MSRGWLVKARRALLDHVLRAAGFPNLAYGASFDLQPYLNLLPSGTAPTQLEAILTTLALGDRSGGPALLSPRPLALDRAVIRPGATSPSNWQAAFENDWQVIAGDAADRFDTASEVLRKHMWAVPGTRGEQGVSLYEEFKLLAALVHASDGSPEPAETFTLVAGDFPGIQRAIYTITSKGAARGLRGRSAFLQLLGDAIVRRLIHDMGLCWCNVVYEAGGNFLLLAPGTGADEVVGRWTRQLSAGLLTSFQGDISFVTACQTVGAHELAGEGFEEAYRALKRQLGAAKQQPFAQIAKTSRADLFEPRGGVSEKHCAVCHHDPGPDEKLVRFEDDWWCVECQRFDTLARDLAEEPPYLSVGDWEPDGASRSSWQGRIYELTGWWYDFHAQPPADGRAFFSLNDTNFIQSGAVGFRFFATLTPRDKEGHIRDFDKIAEDAAGIERIGVLRMDVDSLGKLFGEGLRPLTLTRLSAASSALSLFFDGWLKVLCREIEKKEARPNSLYLIYAGGDDLFVVGPWHLMPILAARVHDELVAYVAGNPAISISAGIETVHPDYPLYRAAERAREALDEGAKGLWYDRSGQPRKKNAISFLGQVVGWGDDWQLVCDECNRLLELDKAGLPKSLIQTVRTIHAQYEEGRQSWGIPQGRPHYGRWMWMQAYQLTRLAEQHKAHRNEIVALQERLLTPGTIHLAGLAARWADYRLRTKTRQGG